MKIFNFFIYLLIIALTLFSCKKNTSFDMCKICGEWNIKSDAMETGEILIFNTDNNFTYKSVGHITESFSQGNWKIKENTLILNSIMPKECFYTLSFGGKCKSSHLLKDELIDKTISECEPSALNKFYVEFKNSKFLIKEDSLIYQTTNKSCEGVPEKNYFTSLKN